MDIAERKNWVEIHLNEKGESDNVLALRFTLPKRSEGETFWNGYAEIESAGTCKKIISEGAEPFQALIILFENIKIELDKFGSELYFLEIPIWQLLPKTIDTGFGKDIYDKTTRYMQMLIDERAEEWLNKGGEQSH